MEEREGARLPPENETAGVSCDVVRLPMHVTAEEKLRILKRPIRWRQAVVASDEQSGATAGHAPQTGAQHLLRVPVYGA